MAIETETDSMTMIYMWLANWEVHDRSHGIRRQAQTYPDMREYRTERFFAVYTEILRDNRNDGHRDTHHTVLEYPDPDDLCKDQQT